jgi:hypothetical protein
MKPRRWLNSQQFLDELELIRLEREERKKAEMRKVLLHVKLGVASADELRLLLPPGRLGKVE